MKQLGTRYLLCWAILSLGTAGTRADVIQQAATEQIAALGQGYSTDKRGFLRGKCIAPKKTKEGDERGSFGGGQTATQSFDLAMDQSQTASQLGFGVGAKFRYGVIKAEAAASFAQESMASSNSLVINYVGQVRMKSIQLEEVSLTELGQELKKNPERWADACGNETVAQVDRGAKLLFSIRLDFSSQKDKNEFNASFKVSGPLFGVEGKLRKASESFKKNVHITLSALQIGGNASKLLTIFLHGKKEAEGERVAAFGDCSFGDFDKCSTILKSAVAYAMGRVEKDSFPNQIDTLRKMGELEKSEGGPATLAYHTARYEEYGIKPTFNSLMTEDIKNARQELSAFFETNLELKLRAQRLASGKVMRLSPAQNARLEKVVSDARANLEESVKAANVCFDGDLTLCRGMVNTLLKDAKRIVASDIEVVPETFAQFCDLSKTEAVGTELAKTVDALVEVARKKFPKHFTDADKAPQKSGPFTVCTVAQELLENETELTLRGMKLVDLRPLKHFKKLRRLDLAENDIVDVTPLAALSVLEWVDLSTNPLRAATPLGALRKLDTLVLFNNSGLRCPLRDPEKCLTGDLGSKDFFQALATPELRDFSKSGAARLSDGNVLIATCTISPNDGSVRARAVLFDVGRGRFETVDGSERSLKGDVVARAHVSALPNGEAVLSCGTQYLYRADKLVAYDLRKAADFAKRKTAQLGKPMVAERVLGRLYPVGPGRYVDIGYLYGGGSARDFSRWSVVQYEEGYFYREAGRHTRGMFLVKRQSESYVDLGGGRILVVGGMNGERSIPGVHDGISATEILDANTGRVATGPTMQSSRTLPGVAPLSSGSLFLVGGTVLRPAATTGAALTKVDAIPEFLDKRTGKFRVSQATTVVPLGTPLALELPSKMVFVLSSVEGAYFFHPQTDQFYRLKNTPPYKLASHAYAVEVGAGKYFVGGLTRKDETEDEDGFGLLNFND